MNHLAPAGQVPTTAGTDANPLVVRSPNDTTTMLAERGKNAITIALGVLFGLWAYDALQGTRRRGK